jgi:oligopeptidase A
MSALLGDMSSNFKEFETRLAGLTAKGAEVSYDDVLPNLERLNHPPSYAWGVAGNLMGVANSDELRKAFEKCQPLVVAAFSEVSQSRVLYEGLLKVEEGKRGLTDAKGRAVEQAVRSMKLGGVGLDGEKQQRFNAIKQRLAELSTKFSNNVLDVTKAYELKIDKGDEEAEMKGVPESAKSMWYKEDEGCYKITLDGPSYVAAMQFLPNRATRETLYRRYVTRASECDGEKNNVPLIVEILELKREMSALLGFENYAEQSLASKMAKDVGEVKTLSDMIKAKALPAAVRELAEITAYAKKNAPEVYGSVERLMPWDVTFWSERLKESKFSITEEELRPYFALPSVLEGMFDLVEKIFGVKVTKVEEGGVEVWHKDVSFYDIEDVETGKKIASFYLDPYSRPENKRGGAWMDTCVGKSAALGKDVPVAYLTCNGAAPVGDKPSLMTFREVETLFHEFGHGLQHMLTKVDVGDVAGINGVDWDAVELPSQFMENWCYHRETVKGFARHWETGEELPAELFDKLVMQRVYGQGMMAMRQTYFGQLDMELHGEGYKGKEGGESVFEVQKRVAAEYSQHMLPIEGDRFLCAFNHIFGGGYAAGYYSYKWAEVMSADAFGKFEEAGLEDEEAVRRVGMEFRETVLGLGGSLEPAEVFRRFRGRDVEVEALMRHNGLIM